MTRKERSGSSSSSKEIAERALYVLDSYALFAYFKDKEGAGIVTDLIRRTAQDVSLFLSLVNSPSARLTASACWLRLTSKHATLSHTPMLLLSPWPMNSELLWSLETQSSRK